MGCRTGFYLVHEGEVAATEVKTALEQTLLAVAAVVRIPGVSELECGNYRDHNLESAQYWAKTALENGFIVQETVLILPENSSQV